MLSSETIELTSAIAEEIFARLANNFKVQATLTLADAASEIGVSQETMRKLCESNEIPFIRVGKFYRIKPSDINAYLERNYVRG